MNSQRVIIVHLRRANPTKHLSTSSQGEIQLQPESLGRALSLQDSGWIGKGSLWTPSHANISCEQINTFPSVFFSSKLTLNSTTVQLPFTTDFQKKVVVSIISFTSKDCVPHNKYAYSSDSSSPRIKLEFKKLRMLLTYRKFNQLFFFLDKCKFISRLFKMLKSRNFNIKLISSSFLWCGDSTGGPLLDWWNF